MERFNNFDVVIYFMAEKVIRDPLYGFISLEKDELALKLIDTPEFQRLKHIRQLGVSFVTYPGANHTRFSHSLGVYHLSQKLYDSLGGKDDDEREKVSIAALLHDVGHSPLSHAFESVLTPGINHEEWTKLIISDSATAINEEIRNSKFTPKEIFDIIIKPSNPSFLHMMISSQLDVDRFDFLQRDSLFTGNPSGKFDIERVLRTLQLSDNDDIYVQTKGVYSVEGYLISRYHMYNQVYMHPTTICCEGLLKNIFKLASDLAVNDNLNPPATLEKALKHETLSVNEFVQLTDNDLFYALGLWKNATHTELSDLCRRLVTRKLLKPIEENISIRDYFHNKDNIEKVLSSKGFNPDYYLVWIEGSEKSAYNPYSPDPIDQLNAIIVEGNKDISEELPNLKYLEIGTENVMGVPEECRDDVTGIVTSKNTRVG
jgi:HD superfamily phosphohydrolase